MIIRRCVHEDEMFDIFKSYNDDTCIEKFNDNRTTYKVLDLRYCWSTLLERPKCKFKYATTINKWAM
jgi:hypothetical protein